MRQRWRGAQSAAGSIRGRHEPDGGACVLYTSFLAGLSLNAVTVLCHTMGYTIAGRTKLGHGATGSLPYCLAYNLGAGEQMRGGMSSAA